MKYLKRTGWYLVGAALALPRIAYGGQHTVTIDNPLESNDVIEIFDNIANFLLIIAFPIAVIMTIWAAFLFMTAGGNQEQVTKAKKTLMYVVIGIVILILSKGVTSLIQSIVGVS